MFWLLLPFTGPDHSNIVEWAERGERDLAGGKTLASSLRNKLDRLFRRQNWHADGYDTLTSANIIYVSHCGEKRRDLYCTA